VHQAIPVAASAGTAAPVAITLTGRVTDAAHMLTPAETADLDRLLAEFEARTGHQMVVVTAPGLGGADIATFTRALGNAWSIGRKDVDDGVVVLLAPAERKARIAVGRGLERTLTDADCAAIMERSMVPQFRNGDYAAGLRAGVVAIAARMPGR
jgi:uncharacterized protein